MKGWCESGYLILLFVCFFFFLPERLEAEKRQKQKVEEKKAKAAAARKSSEDRAQQILRKAQSTRSSVFAAARQNKPDIVRKGIWEDGVDAAGGEIKPSCSQFIKSPPADPQETLLHIAIRNNDLELVQWLDSHSKRFLILMNR